jgi:hypothetical protein
VRSIADSALERKLACVRWFAVRSTALHSIAWYAIDRGITTPKSHCASVEVMEARAG